MHGRVHGGERRVWFVKSPCVSNMRRMERRWSRTRAISEGDCFVGRSGRWFSAKKQTRRRVGQVLCGRLGLEVVFSEVTLTAGAEMLTVFLVFLQGK